MGNGLSGKPSLTAEVCLDTTRFQSYSLPDWGQLQNRNFQNFTGVVKQIVYIGVADTAGFESGFIIELRPLVHCNFCECIVILK